MRNLKYSGLAISLLTTFLFFSCNSAAPSGPERLHLANAIDSDESRDFNGLVEVESIIPLETSDTVLLTDIRKIIHSNNLLFILDTDTRLWLFDMQGNFIRKIGQEGQGPGEYPELADFAIDTQRSEVYINSVLKIVLYDFEGNYKREVNLYNDNLQVLTYCNDKLYYIFPDIQHPDAVESATLVSVLDLDGNLLQEFSAHHLRRVGSIPFFNNIATDGKSVYYKEEFGQALYAIRDNFVVDTLALLDFGKYAFEPQDFDFSKHELWEERYRLQNILPADNFMLFILQKGLIGQDLLPYLWVKKDNTVARFNYRVSYQEDDLLVLPFAVSDGRIIGVLVPPKDSLENDNPVLVVLSIK